MSERQQPDRDSGPVPQGVSRDLTHATRRVIDSQDLEHNAGPETRVNNSGVKVLPPSVPRPARDDADLARENPQARATVEEFEHSSKDLPPG